MIAPGDAGCWREIGVMGNSSCPELKTVVHCRNCPVFSGQGVALLDRPPPAGYRRPWADREAEETDAAAGRQAVIVFRLGEEWLSLESALCVEVAETRTVHRIVHRTNKHLAGLVNIRGQLHLCISLAGLVGVPRDAAPGDRARMIVVSRDRENWVFPVDEVVDVLRFGPSDRENVPATIVAGLAPYTKYVFSWGERRIGHLSGDALFAALRRSVG